MQPFIRPAVADQQRVAPQPPLLSRVFDMPRAPGAPGGVDPDTGVAYGYTVARGLWPGGADPRALALAADLGAVFGA